MSAKIISIINFKGGVLKTTTTANLGYTLANRGKRVLLIDYDPQGSLAFTCNSIYDENMPDEGAPLNETLYHWIDTNEDMTVEQVKNMIHHVTFENRNGNVELDIIRNTIELANAELDVTYKYVNSANISDDEANHTLQYLRNGLQLLRKDYDYILIDCAPNLGMLNLISLVASDFAIIPVDMDIVAIRGIAGILKRIEEINESKVANLKVLGILKTKYSTVRKANDPLVSQAINNYFKDTNIFKTVIPESSKAKNALLYNKIASQSKNVVSEAYEELANEIQNKLGY